MPSSRRPRTRPYRVAASSVLRAPPAYAGNGTLIAAATDSAPPIIDLRVIPDLVIGPPPPAGVFFCGNSYVTFHLRGPGIGAARRCEIERTRSRCAVREQMSNVSHSLTE